MNKKTLIIGLCIAALIALCVGYLLVTRDSTEQPAEQSTAAETSATPAPATPATPSPSPAPAQQAGSYQAFSQAAFNNTSGTRLLFFHAPWCPQCRELEASIQSGGIPAGTTIFKVDYDTSQALRQKYGVTLQTTVVRVDANGNLAKKFVAYDDPNLKAVLQGLQ